MPFETFLGRLKVKVTLESHINELSGPLPLHICMDFKTNMQRCYP